MSGPLWAGPARACSASRPVSGPTLPHQTQENASIDAAYILPVRRDDGEPCDELAAYLAELSRHLEVIVVDGSPPSIFAAHAGCWGGTVRHLLVDPDLVTENGKVGGVLTGVRRTRHEFLVIADDDVRYTVSALRRVVERLDRSDLVRPQNYFHPLPWHARWDTARSLLNRVSGGDWPGTMGVRRSILLRTGGYDGDVMFENLELSRTVRAAGGREEVALDLFVRRLPPSGRLFWKQRVRQAYDEMARPARLFLFLAILPLALWSAAARLRAVPAGVCTVAVLAAEAGRRRAGGAAHFPATSSLLAPAWLVERAICSWLAVYSRLRWGGIRYRGLVIRSAATSMPVLRRRHQGQPEPAPRAIAALAPRVSLHTQAKDTLAT